MKKILNQQSVAGNLKKLGPRLTWKENRIVNYRCPSTATFKGLAHNKFILKTRKKSASFEPIIFRKFPGYDSRPFYEKFIDVAFEKILRHKEMLIWQKHQKLLFL